MANLNNIDVLFLNSKKLTEIKHLLETEYCFSIQRISLPPYISFTCRKVVIHTDRGDFFVKEKPRYCDTNSHRENFSRFQNFLSERCQFVLPLLPTHDGVFFVQHNSRHYFVTPFVKGRIYNGSAKDLSRMLSALIKVQSISKGFQFHENQKHESPSVLEIVHSVSRQIRDDYDQKIYSNILRTITLLKKQYARVENKSYLMSHGDCSIFNILFIQNGLITLNDLDNCKVLPRIHDLAELFVSACLLNYIAPLTNLKKPIILHAHTNNVYLILEFFRRYFHLDKNELQLLPVVVKVIWLENLLLATLKGDYSIADLEPAIEMMESKKLDMLIA